MFRHDGMTTAALDVNELIREVLSLLRGDLENHRIGVDAALPEGLPPVSANAVQLRQVMVNLITNAADAMSTVMNRQRLLRLRTQAHEPGGLLITVEDTGSGIDPRHADRIFEPFLRPNPKAWAWGCRSAAPSSKIHGGHLSVTPGRTHGSIFQVSLPTAPPVAATAAAVTP
jgi:C4-dicarboxylate-specific signal transduction histidine kinase